MSYSIFNKSNKRYFLIMSKLSQLFMLCYCPFIKFQTNEVQDALLN